MKPRLPERVLMRQRHCVSFHTVYSCGAVLLKCAARTMTSLFHPLLV